MHENNTAGKRARVKRSACSCMAVCCAPSPVYGHLKGQQTVEALLVARCFEDILIPFDYTAVSLSKAAGPETRVGYFRVSIRVVV